MLALLCGVVSLTGTATAERRSEAAANQPGPAAQRNFVVFRRNDMTVLINRADRCEAPSNVMFLVSDDPVALADDPLVRNTLLNADGRMSIYCRKARSLYEVPVVTSEGAATDELFFFHPVNAASFALPASMLTLRLEEWLRNDPGTFGRIAPQFINIISGYWDRTRNFIGGASQMKSIAFNFATSDARRCPSVVGDRIEVNWERYWSFGYSSGTNSGSFSYDSEWEPFILPILEEGHAKGRDLARFSDTLIDAYGCRSPEINRMRRAIVQFGRGAYELDDVALPVYEDAPEAAAAAVPAELADFTLTSGGQTYDAADIATLLHDWREALETGFNPSYPDPRFVVFRDDAGQVHIATEEDGRLRIIGMNVAGLKAAFEKAGALIRAAEGEKREALSRKLQERSVTADAGFAFIVEMHGFARARNDLMAYEAFDRMPRFDEWQSALRDHVPDY